MSGAAPRVEIPPSLVPQLLGAHADASGAEPCAALFGATTPTSVQVREAVLLPNTHPEPERAFLMSPNALLAAVREARTRGLAFVGTWHGHLQGPAWFSRADVLGADACAAVPGAHGLAGAESRLLMVSGRGTGRATVLRAFWCEPDKKPTEATLRVRLAAALSA